MIWLKTTIPGIILLGALGSLVAIGILRFIAPPLKKLALKPFNYLFKERAWRYWRSSAAYSHIELDLTNRKLIYYQFYHLRRLLIALFGLAISILLLTIILVSQPSTLLTYSTFLLATLTFLFAYWVWMEYENLTINFIIEWRKTGIVKDLFPDRDDLTATERALKKRGEDESDA